jgi:hypothetical protein
LMFLGRDAASLFDKPGSRFTAPGGDIHRG